MSGESAEGAGRRGLLAVVALLVVLGITVAWWALALWPLPEGASGWVARARSICFGADPAGLPDASGWIALIVQPGLMLGTLLAVWGRSVWRGLSRLAATHSGRAALAAAGLMGLFVVGAGAWRIQEGLARPDASGLSDARAAYRALERPAPELGLIDQHGERLYLRKLRGRPALITFAFGHCETLCPLVVRNAMEARRLSGAEPALVVVTLDPWRDTPARLPHIAASWGLESDDWVLSGSVEEVKGVLDRWNVPRDRDSANGDIAHPPLAYIVDREGRIVFATNGALEVLTRLSEGL